MNIIKRLINQIKGKNPYVENQLENADIIIGENENLTREQRRKRFDEYYKSGHKKEWNNARGKHETSI
jgi:hypothetical protein